MHSHTQKLFSFLFLSSLIRRSLDKLLTLDKAKKEKTFLFFLVLSSLIRRTLDKLLTLDKAKKRKNFSLFLVLSSLIRNFARGKRMIETWG